VVLPGPDPVSGINHRLGLLYNPVSLVLKDRAGWRRPLKPQGVSVTWVRAPASNKAIESLKTPAASS